MDLNLCHTVLNLVTVLTETFLRYRHLLCALLHVCIRHVTNDLSVHWRLLRKIFSEYVSVSLFHILLGHIRFRVRPAGNGNFTWLLMTFVVYCSIPLWMRISEKIKMHNLCSIIFPPWKACRSWDNAVKCGRAGRNTHGDKTHAHGMLGM
jgi:hypothetical protein